MPATVVQTDDTTFEVTPTQPLGSGIYAISWTVQAGDAHPKSGLITFTVGPGPAVAAGEEAKAAETIPTTTARETFASLTAAPDTGMAEWLGRLARSAGLLGTLVGIGALVFAMTVPVASAGESRQIAFWIRRGGLAILGSLLFELIAQAALLNNGSLLEALRIESLASVLAGPLGWAILLRLVGGAALLGGTRLAVTSVASDRAPQPAGGSGRSGPGPGALVASRIEHRLNLIESPMAVIGSIGLIAAFLFDGHTVTASPAWIVRMSDLVHVAAAATWVGGVAMLAATLAMRRRRSEPIDAGVLVLRFSAVASVALAAVGLAGLILASTILDSVGELFSTAWGRTLIVKLVAVGAAAGVGGYNHFVVLPQLTGEGDSETASRMVGRTTLIEAVALIAVVGLTAILVGAPS